MVQLVVIVKILYLNSRDNVKLIRIETIEMRWASKQWNTF